MCSESDLRMVSVPSGLAASILAYSRVAKQVSRLTLGPSAISPSTLTPAASSSCIMRSSWSAPAECPTSSVRVGRHSFRISRSSMRSTRE